MCRIEKKSGLEINRTAGMWCTISGCCCDLCCSPPLLPPMPFVDMAWEWPWTQSPLPEITSSKSSRLDVMVRRILWYLQISYSSKTRLSKNCWSTNRTDCWGCKLHEDSTWRGGQQIFTTFLDYWHETWLWTLEEAPDDGFVETKTCCSK